MKEMNIWSKKEKTLFWAAAMIGLAAGVVGNLFSEVLLKSISTTIGNKLWANLTVSIIIIGSFIWLIYFIFIQIEKNRPVGREKNKKNLK